MEEIKCKTCICLPACIGKSHDWNDSDYVNRFALLTDDCSIANKIWHSRNLSLRDSYITYWWNYDDI